MPEPAPVASLLDVSESKRTVPYLLRTRVEQSPKHELVRFGTRQRTAAETVEATARLAGAMRQAGLGRGDCVAIFAGNRLELLDTVLAAGWLGAVAAPINTALRGQQLTHVLANAAPRLLVTEQALLQAVRPEATLPASLEQVWTVDDGLHPDDSNRFERLPIDGDPVEPADVTPADPLLILYTSGTTGVSKGVVCPHAQLYWWGLLTARYLGLRQGDVLFTTLPMSHMNALNTFFQALLSEATYCVADRFSASRFWKQAHEEAATVTYLLGAMVQILLNQPEREDDRGHNIRVALSPATPEEAVSRFESRFGARIVDGYGSTETNLVLCNAIEPRRTGTMGRLVPEFDARVVDENDEEVHDGLPGELVVRGKEPYSIASGYYGMPDKTVESWRNLWFHTGDRVIRDADGVWHFVDRLKDSIRRRGENISSAEVEAAILTHNAVRLAAVIGVPSELGEEEVMAFVVRNPEPALSPEDLLGHLETRLAYFAIPRFVEFVGELPVTENGKIRKAPLRERGVGAQTWDRHAAGYILRR